MRVTMKSFLAVSMMGAFTVAACGDDKPAPQAAPIVSQGPEWVTKGSGAFGAEGQKVFYGVGVASNIKNVALLQTTADNRARAEITKIFETYSASLMKDYMASVSDGDKVSEEQNVESAIKTFSAQTLSGVQIVDRWKDRETGAMYSLARLDLNAFADSIGKMKELSAKAKDYIRQNAERVHADLEKEEAKAEARKGN
jgi:hypothetical protein